MNNSSPAPEQPKALFQAAFSIDRTLDVSLDFEGTSHIRRRHSLHSSVAQTTDKTSAAMR